jgi:hypothetical protein
MCAQLRKFRNYTTVDALLVSGLSTVLFVIGSILIGYGVHVLPLARIIWLPSVYSSMSSDFNTASIVWIIGVLLMVAGLLGYASLARLPILKLLKRKR